MARKPAQPDPAPADPEFRLSIGSPRPDMVEVEVAPGHRIAVGDHPDYVDYGPGSLPLVPVHEARHLFALGLIVADPTGPQDFTPADDAGDAEA